MSESLTNRIVWADVPVTDLARASGFYRAVLGVAVHIQDMPGITLAVIDHVDGSGACLVPSHEPIAQAGGILVYFNVTGRLRAAVAEVPLHGGTVLEGVHSIGPHGFRALVRDSEGNRIALHALTAD